MKTITVNGERYGFMITNVFWPKLNDLDIDNNVVLVSGCTWYIENVQWTVCMNDLREMLFHAEVTWIVHQYYAI